MGLGMEGKGGNSRGGMDRDVEVANRKGNGVAIGQGCDTDRGRDQPSGSPSVGEG